MAAFIRDTVVTSRVLIGFSSWGTGEDDALLEDKDTVVKTSFHPPTTERAKKLIILLKFALNNPNLAKENPELYEWER